MQIILHSNGAKGLMSDVGISHLTFQYLIFLSPLLQFCFDSLTKTSINTVHKIHQREASFITIQQLGFF